MRHRITVDCRDLAEADAIARALSLPDVRALVVFLAAWDAVPFEDSDQFLIDVLALGRSWRRRAASDPARG